MTRANLFLVGAAKSGTTSLAKYLNLHPKIFVSEPKEPNFFALPEGQSIECRGPLPSPRLVELLLAHSINSRDGYEQLFADAGEAVYRCDASVRYLYDPNSAERLVDAAPDARIVALLREPIDRLHSHYHMNVRFGVEPESLPRAIALEDQRYEQEWGWDWHYVRVGLYGQQLQRYYDRFDASQIDVLIYDDFRDHPQRTLDTLYQSLGVDSHELPVTERRANVGQTPKFRTLRKLMWEDNLVKRIAQKLVPKQARSAVSQWVEKRNRTTIPTVPNDLREQLRPRFQQDQELLETLIGRKLPW